MARVACYSPGGSILQCFLKLPQEQELLEGIAAARQCLWPKDPNQSVLKDDAARVGLSQKLDDADAQCLLKSCI